MAKEFYTEEYMLKHTYEKPTRLSFKDIEGNAYGKISVLGWAGINKYGSWKKPRNSWWCKCDCGETDYFLVGRNSLEKGLTTSCGCNYKNNGGTEVREDIAIGKLDSRYTLLEYKGQNYPCKVSCSVCNEQHEISSFYSLRQQKLVCSCKGTVKTENVEQVLADYNWKPIGRSDNGVLTRCECLSCGITKDDSLSNFKNLCNCHYKISEDEEPCCVYVLQDQNNKSYYKIGVSVTPEIRCSSINRDAVSQGYEHNFKIIHMKWFASPKIAYHVEGLYHRYLKDKTVYGYKSGKQTAKVFDGSCELFELTKEDIIDFNKEYKDHIDKLLTERPKYIITKGEFKEGLHQLKQKDDSVWMWFPYKAKVARYLGYYVDIQSNLVISESIDNYVRLDDINEEIIRRKTKHNIEVDGVIYNNLPDFYQQHLHLAQVEFKIFRDRMTSGGSQGKKVYEIYEALTTPRIRKNLGCGIEDLEGNMISFHTFKQKYNLLIGQSTIQSLWRSGYTQQQIIDYTPRDCYTSIGFYENKWWVLSELYKYLKSKRLVHPSIKSQTFYNRVKNGWDVVTAYSTDSTNKTPYKSLIKQGT